MICPICDGTGLYPFVDAENPKPNAAIVAADLYFAVCLCEAGQSFRAADNNGRRTAPLWQLWCAHHRVDPSRVFLLEEVLSAVELTALGFRRAPTSISRESALLAAGRKVKR